MTITSLCAIRRLLQAGDLEAAMAALEALPEAALATPAAQAVRAVLLLQEGDEAGGDVARAAAAHEPDNAAWASDLGYSLLLAGEAEQALAVLERAVKMPGPDGAAFNRLGAARQLAGDLDGACAAYEAALLRDPIRPEINCNLGALLAGQGDMRGALNHYNRALFLQPDLAGAQAARSRLLLALERPEEAVLELERRLDAATEPEHRAALHRHLAQVLDEAGRFDEACAQLRRAAQEVPQEPDAPVQLATLLCDRGRLPGALAAVNTALARDAGHLVALCLRSRILADMGCGVEADRAVDAAFAAHPDAPACTLARAWVRAAAGDDTGAVADLRQVVEALPGSVDAWSLLGTECLLLGDMPEAEDALRRAAELSPSGLAALVAARVFPDDAASLTRMERFAGNALFGAEARASMLFALAATHEQRGDYDAAFACAHAANTLMRKTIAYDPTAYETLCAAMAAQCGPAFFERIRGAGSLSERPVFVVGMPRSGTTLTEQLIASHPQAFGAGELGLVSTIAQALPRVLETDLAYPHCLARCGRETLAQAAHAYLARTRELVADGADPGGEFPVRVVDKLPHNFLHVGLIAAMFPRARIVHVSRDPRDVAVSTYFLDFRARHGLMGYAYDLEHIGCAINGYRRLMGHWRRVLPLPVYELRYEDLVADPETQARLLLEFVGLPWNDCVMAFHRARRTVKTASAWQVRQPLYATSRERWCRYEAHLGPLFKSLGVSDVRDGPVSPQG